MTQDNNKRSYVPVAVITRNWYSSRQYFFAEEILNVPYPGVKMPPYLMEAPILGGVQSYPLHVTWYVAVLVIMKHVCATTAVDLNK